MHKDSRKFIEDFLKRPIYKELTAEILASVKDEDLEQTIIDNIQTKINADFSDEQEVVRSLTPGQVSVYVTWIVEAEVNNGGFNQFYFNSSGQFSDLAQEAFRTIGAIGFADIIKQANNVYEEIKDGLEKSYDGTIESFSESYNDNPLNDLDDEFYEMYKIEKLSEMKLSFIRKNINEFLSN